MFCVCESPCGYESPFSYGLHAHMVCVRWKREEIVNYLFLYIDLNKQIAYSNPPRRYNNKKNYLS